MLSDALAVAVGVAQAMWSVAQAMWDRLHRLCGPLHRLYGIGCTGYVVRCTGYVGMLHRLCGVKADNKAKPAQLS